MPDPNACPECGGTGKTQTVKKAASGYVTTVYACRCESGEKLWQKEIKQIGA